MQEIEKIVSLTHDEVSSICHPLFKKTPLSYFSYARMYDSGEMMFFNTHPVLADRLFSTGCYATLEELNILNSFGIKTTLMSPSLPLPLGAESSKEKYNRMNLLAAELSLYYGFFVVDRGLGYYRICGFGTNVDKNSMVNFYLNAFPLLERFIRYFEYHARDLIESYSKSDLISLDNYHQKIIVNAYADEASLEIPQLDFSLNQGGNSNHGIKGFTSREQECLKLIAQGFTMKNTARQLAISHRTVEQHLRNIKDKFGVNTKNQLVEIWHEYFKKNEEL